LFLIMINDLPNKIKDTETTLFADDSCMFKSGKKFRCRRTKNAKQPEQAYGMV